MTSIYTSTHLDTAGYGELTTTTYVESVKSETRPEKQIVSIIEQIVIPGYTELDSVDQAINSFFSTDRPVEVWLDSLQGEVMNVETFDFTTIPMEVVALPVGSVPIETSPEAPDEGHALVKNLSAVMGTLAQARGATEPDPTLPRSLTCPQQIYKSKSMNVKVNAGEPKKIVIHGSPKRSVRMVESNQPFNYDIACVKYYGQITSDAFTESTEQEVAKDGRITLKTVFSTIGKIIKVVAQIAEIVIPIMMTVVRDEVPPSAALMARDIRVKRALNLGKSPKRLGNGTVQIGTGKRKRQTNKGKPKGKKAKR